MRNNKNSFTKKLNLIGFPLLFVGIIILIILYFNQFSKIFLEPESLKAWVKSWGVTAPIVFIIIQILQVVIFVIPGEIPQIAGGYLFGTFFGTIFSVIGICIGSAINFFLARLLGVPFITMLFKEEKIKKMHDLALKPKFQIILFILFLIPGIPKDIFTYIAGLSPIGFIPFLFISGSGRLPGILGSALIGDAAAAKNWVLVIIISVIATILFFIGFFFREKIFSFLKKTFARKHQENEN